MMKIPPPMPADEILAFEMKNSPLNQEVSKRKIGKPGSNPWTKYLIVGGVILVAGFAAYHLTKPKKINYTLKNENDGKG